MGTVNKKKIKPGDLVKVQATQLWLTKYSEVLNCWIPLVSEPTNIAFNDWTVVFRGTGSEPEWYHFGIVGLVVAVNVKLWDPIDEKIVQGKLDRYAVVLVGTNQILVPSPSLLAWNPDNDQ